MVILTETTTTCAPAVIVLPALPAELWFLVMQHFKRSDFEVESTVKCAGCNMPSMTCALARTAGGLRCQHCVLSARKPKVWPYFSTPTVYLEPYRPKQPIRCRCLLEYAVCEYDKRICGEDPLLDEDYEKAWKLSRPMYTEEDERMLAVYAALGDEMWLETPESIGAEDLLDDEDYEKVWKAYTEDEMHAERRSLAVAALDEM